MIQLDSKLRVFIAIPLPAAVQTAMARDMALLREQLSFQKWVHPEDLHLTLKFIGDIAPSALRALEAGLERVAARSVPFPLRLDGAGTFGPPRAPRVLWAGLAGGLQALHRLQADVERQAAEAGYAPEARAFAPHVTLARRFAGCDSVGPGVTGVTGVGAGKAWSADADWLVDRIVLYRTHMGRSPMYERIGEYAFHAEG